MFIFVRTSSEYDGLLQPSFTESSTSVQGTSEQATMETAGTTQSVYTDQSEEPVPYEPVEKQVEEVIDKRLVTELGHMSSGQKRIKMEGHCTQCALGTVKVNRYTFRGSNSFIFSVASHLKDQLIKERICSSRSNFFL